MSRIQRALLATAIAAAGCGKGKPPDWLTVPTRTSHDGFFVISTGVHAQADCIGCHGTYDTFKQFDCSTSACHVGIAQKHAGTIATDGPSCVGCHPKGTMPVPPTHDTAFFPRGSGTAHATVACTQCHQNPTPTAPTDFGCQACLGCYACHSTLPAGWTHPDPVGNVHILVISTSTSLLPNLQLTQTPIDVTNNPASCLRCHADSQRNTVASHPVGSDTPSQNDIHAGAGCLTCHTAPRTDKTFGTDFSATPPPPGSTNGCGTCHATLPP